MPNISLTPKSTAGDLPVPSLSLTPTKSTLGNPPVCSLCNPELKHARVPGEVLNAGILYYLHARTHQLVCLSEASLATGY